MYSFSQYKRISVLQFRTNNCDSFLYGIGMVEHRANYVRAKVISEKGVVKKLIIGNPLNEYLFFNKGDIISTPRWYVLDTPILVPPLSYIFIPINCPKEEFGDDSILPLTSDREVVRDFWKDECFEEGHSSTIDLSKLEKYNLIESRLNFQDGIDFQRRLKKIDPEAEKKYKDEKRRMEEFDKYLNNFRYSEYINGVAFFVDNKLHSIEIFNSETVYLYYNQKVFLSAVSEFYNMEERKVKFGWWSAFRMTTKFLSKIHKIKYVEKPNPGVGVLKSFQDERIAGHMLTFGDYIIHLSAVFFDWK